MRPAALGEVGWYLHTSARIDRQNAAWCGGRGLSSKSIDMLLEWDARTVAALLCFLLRPARARRRIDPLGDRRLARLRRRRRMRLLSRLGHLAVQRHDDGFFFFAAA